MPVRTAQRGEDSWHKNEDFKSEVPGAHPREDPAIILVLP